MAYKRNYDYESDGDPKVLAYDLRQKLAEQLGAIREQIIESRLSRNYPRWFILLDSLFIEVSKKLSDDEMNDYNNRLIKVNEAIRKTPQAYANVNSQLGEEIYLRLRDLDIWLNRKMEEYDMFGSKDEDIGL